MKSLPTVEACKPTTSRTHFFFGTRRRKAKKKIVKKENYLENQVPLASASRCRCSPAGGLAMEE
jgi:hypothetical protein